MLIGIALELCGVGCGGGARKIADSAVVGAVSSTQNSVAYYTDYQLPSVMGTLNVAHQGAVVEVGQIAYGATFLGASDNLVFGTNRTLDPTTVGISYGALNLWTPALGASVQVSKGFAIRYVSSPNGSFVLFEDAAAPTADQTGDVVLVRSADCHDGGCASTTVATSEQISSMGFSADGRFAAFIVIRGNGDSATHESWMVDVGSGTATMIGSSTLSAAFSFSPDGTLVAVTRDTAGTPRQLFVLSTADLSSMPWTMPGSGLQIQSLSFVDSGTLVVETTDGSPAPAHQIFSTTPNAATMIVMPSGTSIAGFTHIAATNRWLFVRGVSGDMAESQLLAWDLTNAAVPPTILSLLSDGQFAVSEDGSTVALLDSFDGSTGTGTLTTVGLTTGARTTIADNVLEGAYAFAPSTNRLLWLDALDGTGTLRESNPGATQPTEIGQPVFNFLTRSAPDTLYYSVVVAGSQSDLLPSGIWAASLPAE